MIRRSAVLGLSLSCALLVCVLAAQSASAVAAKNTTAFTCVDIKEGGDFSDAHCDKKSVPGKGKFGHVVITAKKNTPLSITNQGTKNNTTESTNTVFKGILAGIAVEVECKTFEGEGSLENEELEAKKHKFKTVASLGKSGCTVTKPAICKVKEPITMNVIAEGVEELGPEKNTMGVEFKPKEGKTLFTLTIEGEECALAGEFNVEGTMIATGEPGPAEKHSGATKVFTTEMTKETLIFGGNKAEFSGKTTVRMAPEGGKQQNPIGFTTAT
jgi:hypothetical protein